MIVVRIHVCPTPDPENVIGGLQDSVIPCPTYPQVDR